MNLENRYNGYVYGYPHKTAYRPFDRPIGLRELWAAEHRDASFLYLHIPFCEMRCGFCNLFTTSNPASNVRRDFLDALQREAAVVRQTLGEASFARAAIGGGTPTILDLEGLETLFHIIERIYQIDPHRVPLSVETSPLTAEQEKLTFLRQRGVRRISIGVQSFLDHEAQAAGRSQKREIVETALERIRSAGFPVLNIDLIYGLPTQTVASWVESMRAALQYAPEEIYLYPLYRRPLTGLGRRGLTPELDLRLECYRAGREILCESGYRQISMRSFIRASGAPEAGPSYCCQNDGMVGLGCGARSYTRAVHYSKEYAVGSSTIRGILQRYIETPSEEFGIACFGYELDRQEQRRRFILQSLLQTAGVELAAYRERFGSDAMDDFQELIELSELDLAVEDGDWLRLNEQGIEMSDAIGPALYSPRVRNRMQEYILQ